MRYLFTFFSIALLTACGTGDNTPVTGDSTATTAAPAISEVRENPQSSPVANLEERVENDLNTWYFRVQLYQTRKRFTYRLVMEHEAIKEQREITFPNLNMEPQPEIRKGAKEHEAIVGFLDEKGEFREFLKVFVENGNLRLKQLKNYAVYTK